jgi:hypothetical protein
MFLLKGRCKSDEEDKIRRDQERRERLTVLAWGMQSDLAERKRASNGRERRATHGPSCALLNLLIVLL